MRDKKPHGTIIKAGLPSTEIMLMICWFVVIVGLLLVIADSLFDLDTPITQEATPIPPDFEITIEDTHYHCMISDAGNSYLCEIVEEEQR